MISRNGKLHLKKEELSFSKKKILALNYPYALFNKELQLKTIPIYFIYYKEGKLTTKNAFSPDSNEIRLELNKYLKE
jgi:hypothetical protein